jgi:hypothetical protein
MGHVGSLWDSGDEQVWHDALKSYWSQVKQENLKLEEEMAGLDPEMVKQLDPREWYDFLNLRYFPWKYTAKNRLATSRKQLERYPETNNLGELFSIKENLFAFDRSNIREGLQIAKSIKGLGWAGASGLLSLLFPKWFGTVDQFVVRNLNEINSLPQEERRLLGAMNPESLTLRNATLLTQIMRRKADEINALFRTDEWTPRKIDMVLWGSRDNPRIHC